MTDPRQQSGHECPPQKEPAPQPHPPGDDCAELPKTTPPTLETQKCDPPDPCCKCPTTPSSTPGCLEELITGESEQVTAGDKAKAFKAELEALLGKAKTAAQEYTRSRYDTLVKRWEEQDREIAELIRKLVCAVPCWRCIIECYICPLINEVIYAQRRLYDDGKLYDKVNDLYDLRYWHGRDRDAKQRQFDRISKVLTAWEKPAATIEKNLTDDAKLISDANKALGAEAPKTVYDVFLRLVPMHLAIAPPSKRSTTAIAKEYTEFCPCDAGKPDDCCGPDVGQWSVRQRLIGPQPYLIDPNDYFGVICCIVKHRYRPVKDTLAEATAKWQSVDDEIKRNEKFIEERLKPSSFEKDAKGAIPSVVDCCGPALGGDEPQSSQAR
jgi:hypothetical protein